MHNVVLIPGDGIGKEITDSVRKIIDSSGIQINWVPAIAGLQAWDETGDQIPEKTAGLIREHRVALKGPLTTPVGKGFKSANVMLRQMFNLYSNIRPARSLPGVQSPYKDIDLITFRENTEGLYIGRERWITENEEAELTGVITRKGSERVIRSAFDFARKHRRKRIALAHKANILKISTGLFLQIGNEIAKEYPEIEYRDIIIDNLAMQMVINPWQFDIIVTTNLFGDIISDLAAGLVGGLGVTGSANFGDDCAIFEAVHGSAPDIAGKNIANPTALLLSAIMMLNHLDEHEAGLRIHKAINSTLSDKKVCTPDVGGTGNTATYTEAICSFLRID
jgi:isocitrate dehydrogenase (NAD+)